MKIAEPSQRDQFIDLCDEVAQFMMDNDKGRCFPPELWDLKKASNFIHYHFNRKTILFVRRDGELRGATCWWRWNSKDLDIHNLDVFDRELPENDPAGDMFYYADLVTTDAKASSAISSRFRKLYPDWETCSHWGTRRNKQTGKMNRVQYSNRLLQLLGRV
jgi:hypothetical protein